MFKFIRKSATAMVVTGIILAMLGLLIHAAVQLILSAGAIISVVILGIITSIIIACYRMFKDWD